MSAAKRETAIAVIGMGCRFPQARGVEEFWDNLVANRDCVTPVPPERFDITPFWAEESGVPGRTASRHGGFLDDPFHFDAGFFGISPAEATSIDPQHRLLLPVVREALDDAGIRPPRSRAPTPASTSGRPPPTTAATTPPTAPACARRRAVTSAPWPPAGCPTTSTCAGPA
ncbi:beta-ketoacyl synthase N-terminal-like domain-containing protein [Streptomyces diastatochromogenes]|nr:beta-ketoacyl synthase N-terminal-like domain-containing protein [Streptomyces diastatochromogenes]